MYDDGSNVDQSIQLEPLGPQHKSSQLPLYALLSVGVVISVSVLVLLAIKLTEMLSEDPADTRVSSHRPRADLNAESSTTFHAFASSSGKQPTTLSAAEKQQDFSEIEAIFVNIEECIANRDNESLREHIDFDRLLRRIELTGSLYDWSSLEKRMVRSELKDYVDAGTFWGEIQVVGVVMPPGDSNSRVVYALCESTEGETSEDRFWLARSDGTWKLYDWEQLDLGLSISREYGAYCKYLDTPALKGFNRWAELVQESDQFVVDGDYEKAGAKLRLAELEQSPAELQGYKWILTAYRWSAMGNAKETIRCSKAVPKPRETPGVYYNLAYHQQWTNPKEALKNALIYEEIVGPNYELVQIKARLLEDLNRKQESLEARKMLLSMRPGDPTTLLSYLVALPEEHRSAIEPILSELDDPIKVVSEMVSDAQYQDYTAFEYLVDYLKRESPNDPATLHAMGSVEQHRGEYEKAADLFHQAYNTEKTIDVRDIYADSYVAVMQDWGKVLNALQEVPDVQQAIESLLYSYEDFDSELTEEEYEAVIDLYFSRFPTELNAIKRKVTQAIEKQQYEKAQQILGRALEQLPAKKPTDPTANEDAYDEIEYYRESFQESVARILYEQGLLRQAYDAPGDKTERLEQLARLALADKRIDDVRQLLSWHQQVAPNDRQALFVWSDLESELGNTDIAIEFYKRGLKATIEDESWYRDILFKRLCLKADRWRDYYSIAKEPSEAFYDLSDDFIENHQWQDLDALTREHRAKAPDDPRLIKSAAEAAWERKHYDAYLRYANELLRTDDEELLALYERERIVQRMLSSELRQQRWASALSRAQKKLDNDGESQLLAIVSAARGDAIDAKKFAVTSAARSGEATTLYHHDDVGHLFLEKSFRDLQHEYPVSLAYDVASIQSVCLLDSVSSPSWEEIAEVLDRLSIQAVVEPIESVDPKVKSAFTVRFRSGSVWIATGESKFNESWKLVDETLKLAPLVDGHRAWVAIGVTAWSSLAREQASSVARAVCVALARERANAVCVSSNDYLEQFVVIPARPDLLQEWQQTGGHWAVKDEAEKLDYSYKPQKVPENRRFRQELRQAVHEYQSSDSARLTVWVCVTDNLALGPMPLDVTKVQRSYDSLQFEGVLRTSSQLIPELQSGLPMRFDEYNVVSWQLDDQPPRQRP